MGGNHEEQKLTKVENRKTIEKVTSWFFKKKTVELVSPYQDWKKRGENINCQEEWRVISLKITH